LNIERCNNWNPIGITLQSADDDYCPDAARLVIYAFGRRIEFRLPQIIKPFRIRHKALSWNAETIARMGRDWYDEVFPREYGFRVSEGFLQVFLGPQTNDSVTTRSWSCFLPWTQWRFVRLSLYGLTGEEFWTQRSNGKRRVGEQDDQRWQAATLVGKACFRLMDYDGEIIKATTHIEEREWLRGDKWCSWLSLFYRPLVRRCLEIQFDRETGPRKGSWKGGTMGTGIDMLPGELHEAAFKRYCAANKMTYLGIVGEEVVA
jgi:hypothetical protein